MRIERLGRCVVVFDKIELVRDQDCGCVVPAREEPVCLWKGVRCEIGCSDELRRRWERRQVVGEELWRGVDLGWTQLPWLRGSMGCGQ